MIINFIMYVYNTLLLNTSYEFTKAQLYQCTPLCILRFLFIFRVLVYKDILLV